MRQPTETLWFAGLRTPTSLHCPTEQGRSCRGQHEMRSGNHLDIADDQLHAQARAHAAETVAGKYQALTR